MLTSSLLFLFLFFFALPSSAVADVGTAASYGPPYLPTACYGNDQSQFPVDELFAAAGEGIWDNGAACGRQYLVRCLSAATRGACAEGQQVSIIVVDRASKLASPPSRNGTTLVLNTQAYGMIANLSVVGINVEYTDQV
ncbi:EG45-like domain containing protein 2 [Ananas comosus]|uniref:EG45-like domain containing protein 2 n=1 Tax=Ananas comosus TaxID=4615 RepID=A0A199V985_ANACO|nr:EG45-like domain containing protein 2 [Ananas comosus]